MLDTELQARLHALGIPADKAADLTRRIRDQWHPESAVAAVKIAQAVERKAGVGLGGTASGALSMGGTGASIGKFAGPMGIAIGAIAGAIAGFAIKKGHKAERAKAAQEVLAELHNLPPDFGGRQLNWNDYDQLFLALFIAGRWFGYQGSKLTDHPSSMAHWWHTFRNMTRACILASLNSTAPTAARVGLPVVNRAMLYRGRMGLRGLGDYPGATVTATWQPEGLGNVGRSFTFVNPGLGIGAVAYTQQVLMPALRSWIHDAPASVFSDPDAIHVFALMYDKLLSEVAPGNVSTQIATQPVADVPSYIAAAGAALGQRVVNSGALPTVVVPATGSTPQPTPYLMPSGSQQVPVVAPGGSIVLAPPGTTQAQLPPGYTIYQQASGPTVPYGPSPGWVPASTNLNPVQDMTAGILQSQISQQGGVNMVSPDAQQLVADVAKTGVQQAGVGPSGLSSKLLLPLLAGAFGLAVVMRK